MKTTTNQGKSNRIVGEISNGTRVIDLSAAIYSGMETYPGDPEVDIDCVHNHATKGWELRKISMGSHTGTHVDAFSHMHQTKGSLDDIAIERFMGRAAVVALDDDWPEEVGLFFITPIGIDVFERIVKSRPGFVGGNLSEELERALLGEDIITYTNLINLDLIPKGRTFLFIGLPLKIRHGDGSPVRAIAIVEEGPANRTRCPE